jgi:flagellar protein FlbT
MTGRLKIHLKANETIIINGGTIKVDRKVGLELMDNVGFLLGAHLIAPDEARTPLQRLYVAAQSMLTRPHERDLTLGHYIGVHKALMLELRDPAVLGELVEARDLVQAGRPFEAMKRIRALFDALPSAGLAASEPGSAVAGR